MVLSKRKCASLISIVCFAMVMLNDVSTIQFGGRSWTMYYFFSFIALGTLAALGVRLAGTQIHKSIYLLVAVLTAYVLASALQGGAQNLISLVPYAVTPVLFSNIGARLDDSLGIKAVVAVLAVNVLLALAYKFYFSFGYSGPFGSFRAISEYLVEAQIDASRAVRYGRSSGSFANPNALGAFGCLSAFVVLAYGRESPILRGAGVFLAFLLVGLSGSRGSLVALFVGLLAVAGHRLVSQDRTRSRLRVKNPWVRLGIGAAALTIFVFLGTSLFSAERFLQVFELRSGAGAPDSLVQRREFWGVVLRYISDNPLGTIVPPQLRLGVPTDNQFMDFLAWGGFPLAIAFCAFLVWLVFASFSRASMGGSGVLLGLTMALAVNSGSMAVLNGAAAFVFWFGLGVCVKKGVAPLSTRGGAP